MCLKKPAVIAFVMVMVPYASAFAGDIPAPTTEVPAAATGNSHPSDDNTDQNRTMTGMSARDRFRVSIRSNVDPLPLGRIHSWTVHIETPEGVAVEDAQIIVDGRMPAHKHGLPTEPRLTEILGSGDYLVDGVKFSMPGQWELTLIITAGGVWDEAKFKFDLP